MEDVPASQGVLSMAGATRSQERGVDKFSLRASRGSPLGRHPVFQASSPHQFGVICFLDSLRKQIQPGSVRIWGRCLQGSGEVSIPGCDVTPSCHVWHSASQTGTSVTTLTSSSLQPTAPSSLCVSVSGPHAASVCL